MRKKRKSGTRVVLVALSVLAGTPAFFPGVVPAADKKEKPAAVITIVAGTVFRDSGFALPGAEVTLQQANAEGVGKGKKLSFSCNTRGEFAFRLPGQEGKFVVTASAKGYGRQEKTVEAHPGERVDVTFTLVAESNK